MAARQGLSEIPHIPSTLAGHAAISLKFRQLLPCLPQMLWNRSVLAAGVSDAFVSVVGDDEHRVDNGTLFMRLGYSCKLIACALKAEGLLLC